MSWGRLSDAQREAIRPFVVDKTVTDLGAGDGSLASQLLGLGARLVVAIEKEHSPRWISPHPGISWKWERFNPSHVSPLVFVSWPANRVEPALLHLVAGASTVIYLGSNVNSSMCAWPGFYERLATRRILAHVPEVKNTLTIYDDLRVQRAPTGEELAGMKVYEKEYTFEEAERESAFESREA